MLLAVTDLNFGENVHSKQISCLTKEAVHKLKEKGAAIIYKPVEKHIPIHEVERTL